MSVNISSIVVISFFIFICWDKDSKGKYSYFNRRQLLICQTHLFGLCKYYMKILFLIFIHFSGWLKLRRTEVPTDQSQTIGQLFIYMA